MELITGLLVFFGHLKHLVHIWNELPLPMRWVGTGFILIFVELNSRQAVAIWLALAAFLTAVPALFMTENLLSVQVVIFTSLAAVGIYNRPIILRNYVGEGDKFPVPAKRLIGRTAVCTASLARAGETGLVSVAGHEWRALEISRSLVATGEKVAVIGRHGTVLLVRLGEAGAQPDLARIDQVIGAPATWAGGGRVTVRGATGPAVIWPPGAKFASGQPVTIIGLDRRKLIVEAAGGTKKKSGDFVGSLGVCKEAIVGRREPGTADIEGVLWTARAFKEGLRIEPDQAVRVVEMDGAVVIVTDVLSA